MAGDKLFFHVYDDSYESLWVTDGTEAGTRKLAENFVYSPFYNNCAALEVTEKMIFFSQNGDYELWTFHREDGTASLLKEINQNLSGYSLPGAFRRSGDKVFFVAFHPEYGSEL